MAVTAVDMQEQNGNNKHFTCCAALFHFTAAERTLDFLKSCHLLPSGFFHMFSQSRGEVIAEVIKRNKLLQMNEIQLIIVACYYPLVDIIRTCNSCLGSILSLCTCTHIKHHVSCFHYQLLHHLVQSNQ